MLALSATLMKLLEPLNVTQPLQMSPRHATLLSVPVLLLPDESGVVLPVLLAKSHSATGPVPVVAGGFVVPVEPEPVEPEPVDPEPVEPVDPVEPVLPPVVG